MRLHLFTFILIMMCIPKYFNAQTEFHWDWVSQFYGGTTLSYDYAIDADENIYVCGLFNDFIEIGDTVIYQPSFYNYIKWGFLMKYNWEGELLWYKIISTNSESSYVVSISVDVDTSNNVYLAGRYFDEIIIDNIILNPPNDSYSSCYLVKFDQNANHIWNTQVSGSISDDSFGDFKIIDTCIYFSSMHSFWGDTCYLYLGTNDSIQIIGDKPHVAFSSFDLHGHLNWIQTYYSAGSPSHIRSIVYCDKDTIYLCGFVRDTIYVQRDTIYAAYPTTHGFDYLLKYSLDGEYIDADVHTDFPISSFYRGPDNDLIITGKLWTDLIINEDTLIQYNPSLFYNHLIGRFDQDLNPVWINRVDAILSSPGKREFCQTTIDSSIYAMVFYEDSCIVENDTFSGYPKSYCFIKYDNNGDFISAKEVINTSGNSVPRSFVTNTCGNLYHAGYFTQDSYFNNDTLTSVIGKQNLFFAKLNLYPENIELGQDTIACNSLLLEPSHQFSKYSWNDGSSSDPSLYITESGYYWLYASNENNCSGSDTIYISIIYSPDITLGSDTMITSSDTLRLELSDNFDYYEWQDGSNQHFFDIIGSMYSSGNYTFSVHVLDSLCYASDTINVNIINDFSIGDEIILNDIVKIYPIPAENNLFIEYLDLESIPSSLTLYSVTGNIIYSEKPTIIDNKTIVDVSNLKPGLYFLTLTYSGFHSIYKVIKI